METINYNVVGQVGNLILKMKEDPKFRELLMSKDLDAKKAALKEIDLDPQVLLAIGEDLNRLFVNPQVAIWVPTDSAGFVDKINPER
jgi:hypothetical protein